MATTKETMKTIAMGLGENGARETDSYAGCPLVDALARRAAEHFAGMTEEMDEEVVLEIVRKLETETCSDEPGAMIALLGRIFRQNGMFAAFLGLVPGENTTSDSVNRLSIMKAGKKHIDFVDHA